MKVEKIVASFKRTNKGQCFEDCAKALEAKRYKMDTKQGKGKHVKFTKPNTPMIIIPKKNPVSPDTVKDALRVWEL